MTLFQKLLLLIVYVVIVRAIGIGIGVIRETTYQHDDGEDLR